MRPRHKAVSPEYKKCTFAGRTLIAAGFCIASFSGVTVFESVTEARDHGAQAEIAEDNADRANTAEVYDEEKVHYTEAAKYHHQAADNYGEAMLLLAGGAGLTLAFLGGGGTLLARGKQQVERETTPLTYKSLAVSNS